MDSRTAPSEKLALASCDSTESASRTQHQVWKQVAGSVVVATVTLSFSCLLGFGSILLGQLDDPDAAFTVTLKQQQWLMSSAYLGVVIGCLLAMFLAKTLGPSRIMFWHTVPCAVGWGLQALATGFWWMTAGRFICGLACGVCVSSAQIYISEISSPRLRGVLLIFPETFATIGLLMCYTLGLLMNWRYAAVVCGLVPNLAIFLGFFWLPESPTWLVSKHRLTEAVSSLLFFRGAQFEAEAEVQFILEGLERTKMRPCETLGLLRQWIYLKAVLIVATQMTILNFSGVNAMFGYAVAIFRLANTGINAYHCAMVLSAVRVLCNVASTSLVDRLGRRLLLAASGALCTATLSALGAYFYLQQTDGARVAGLQWFPLAAMLLTICSYSLGIGPLSWVLFGEMLPSSVREMLGSIVISVWSVTLFAILQVYYDLNAALGYHGSFWMFAGVCLFQTVFALFAVPETRLRTLEAIQDEHFDIKKETSSATRWDL